jgi:hypothetical protein
MPKDCRQLADVRTDILRGVHSATVYCTVSLCITQCHCVSHSVTVYRTALFCPRIPQKKVYTNILTVTATLKVRFRMCCMPIAG